MRLSVLAPAVAALVAALRAAAAPLDVAVSGQDGKPLADAWVFLESREARAAARPLQNVEIAQSQRRFVQRVTVVTPGTEVRFPNHDTVRHHVYSFSPAKTFELKLYIGTPANPVVFDRPGVAVLGCNIHDTMVAWVLVVETPYFGRTDAAGRLRLDSAPPGNYRLRVWHPALPPGAPASDEGLQLAASGTAVATRLPVAAGLP